MRAETVHWAARGAGLAIGAGSVLVVAYVALAALPVLLLVFLAILLGAALEPLVAWIRVKTGMRRGFGILVVYALFLAVVIGLAVLVIPAALVQFETALSRFPAFLDQVRASTANLRPEVLAAGINGLLDAAAAPFAPKPPPDPDTVVGASLLVASSAAALITLLTLVFFWLTERSRLQRYALAFLPIHRRAGVREAWNEIESRLGGWVRGQLFMMGSIGLATAIAYTILGLPAALLLALIAAIAELVPIVGPLLGAVPALLIASTVSPETAVLTLAVYVALQFIEANILVPLVMRNAVGLTPFLVLFSLLIGGAAGGILGALVAVPLVAAIAVVLERLQARAIPVPIDPTTDRDPDAAEQDHMESVAPDSPANIAPKRQRSERARRRPAGPSTPPAPAKGVSRASRPAPGA
ncbi:MAG: AI-2E family transporter [Chloroflexota bacterium]